MGNRAVITTSPYKPENLGVYVHWNGGKASIEGFLNAAKVLEFRYPEQDNYGWARLAQIIANYFGADGTSVGIDQCKNLDTDNGDNGTYLIEKWEIIGRHEVYEDFVEEVDDKKRDEITNACVASIVGEAAALYRGLVDAVEELRARDPAAADRHERQHLASIRERAKTVACNVFD